ncbi:MAG: RNA polymerase sigma factor [Candidatus Marinimicrobia bacterium]|nr:RNA polymerase sigma factor [Candidatus Neomarinimicrobiota bacterium]
MIRIKQRDKEAFGELLKIYQKTILNYTYSLIGSRDDSQDIVQEVFIKIWTKSNRFDLNKNFTPWIFKITTNLCKDYWRSNSKTAIRNDDYSREKSIEKEPSNSLAFQESEVLSIVNVLPDKQKLVYILRDLQELNIADISSILNISKSSVKTNLFYARKKLHQHLIKINTDYHHEL